MASAAGSGLYGSVIVAAQSVYGAIPSFTTSKAPLFKSFKPTHNQHPVQGGPYLRNGELVDLGSAREAIYLDAIVTLSGDMASTGAAALLNAAIGGGATLSQLGTTLAYGLGGSTGTNIGSAAANGSFIDLQVQNPDAAGTLHPFTYHSGVVTKAVWVFDRTGLVTYEYDLDFQTVETTTVAATVTEPAAPVPFTMANAASAFKVGVKGSETAVGGVRKATITLEPKYNTTRIYLGNQLKSMPVPSDKIKITVALDVDYEADAKAALFDLQIAATPISLVCSAVGAMIGATTTPNTFTLNPTNLFVDTGGEAPLDGPDLIKNTINLSGTIDTAGDPAFNAILLTADTSL